MIRTCKNCAGKIVFDIGQKSLYCEHCGSTFDVSEYDTNEDYIENDVVDTYKDMMDCNIYQCNSCGAEISINDTEASTFCIYCGNPAIVFSRVARLKKPDMIIPFEISKDEALNIVRNRIGNGFFIPREIKNFKPELLRGIYIPYYVTKVEHDVSAIISAVQSSGKNSHTYYHERSGYASLPWITTDASTTLSDSSSQRLEPYALDSAKPFDEDYLVGFYSDMADVDEADAIATAKKRAKTVVEEELFKSVKGSSKKIYNARYDSVVYDKPVTAMLPAWFLTFRYKDKPYTIIVNGQTGKVVGGVPWNKALFITLLVITSVIFSVVSIAILNEILPSMFGHSFCSTFLENKTFRCPKPFRLSWHPVWHCRIRLRSRCRIRKNWKWAMTVQFRPKCGIATAQHILARTRMLQPHRLSPCRM